MNGSLDEYRYDKKMVQIIEQDNEAYISNHFPQEYALLLELPGVKKQSAAVILGEISPHVEAFPTVGHLSSCAGGPQIE